MHDVENPSEGFDPRLTPRTNPLDAQAEQILHNESLLVRELTHRIANDWTNAISMISIAAHQSNCPDVKSVLNDLSRQLLRRAELMRALQIPNSAAPLDAAEYLERVCLAVSRSRLQEQNVHLVFTAETLPTAANSCLRLGMILCELLTNSARHAYPDRSGGTIAVSLRRIGHLAECRVTDDGCGRSGPKKSSGYGLGIAQELIASLGGSIQHFFGPSGSTSILQFPL